MSASLRFCKKTKQLEFYDRFYAIVWRVDGHPDDWLTDSGDWARDKTERALYDTRAGARADRPSHRLGSKVTTKLVRIYRRVK